MPSSERREQLLDVTGELILKHGLNSFTMETLTREAGVSKPLAYKYFATRLELLQALLLREHKNYYDRLENEVSLAENYTEVMRIMVESNFKRASGQDLIKTLRDQSDVDAALLPILAKSGNRIGDLLIRLFLQEFDVKPALARRIVRMASGASLEAAQRHKIHGGNQKQQIDETVRFIFGGIKAFL